MVYLVFLMENGLFSTLDLIFIYPFARPVMILSGEHSRMIGFSMKLILEKTFSVVKTGCLS